MTVLFEVFFLFFCTWVLKKDFMSITVFLRLQSFYSHNYLPLMCQDSVVLDSVSFLTENARMFAKSIRYNF